MSRIREHLQRIIADKKVTAEEVQKQLLPEAEKLPKRASGEAREILDLWLNDRLEIDAFAENRIKSFLESRGYPIPASRHLPEENSAKARFEASIVGGNVTETDAVFENLSRLLDRGEETTVIAVLDNEFDLAHPAFADSIAVNPREIPGNGIDDDGNKLVDDRNGFDFSTGRPDVYSPENPHGTHVLAIATQGTDRIKAIPLKVWDKVTPQPDPSRRRDALWGPLRPHPVFDAQKCADAIDYAVSQGAKIINMSLITTEAEEVGPLEQAIRRHPNVLFILGAGNDHLEVGTGKYAPDRHLGARPISNMVLVTATAREDKKPDKRHAFGDKFVELAAPGSLVSAIPGEKYARYTGTSMATPYVTSIAGKCLALDPSLSPEVIRQIIHQTSDPAEEWNSLVSARGCVNSDRALRVAAAGAMINGEGVGVAEALNRLSLTGSEREHVNQVLAKVLLRKRG